jgi:hypothetical protein
MSFFDRGFHEVPAEAVGQVAVIKYRQNEQVSLFAGAESRKQR